MSQREAQSLALGVRGEQRAWQRERIVAAMVELSATRGFHGVTLAALCARARVSRRCFYEHFADLNDCFVVVLDRGLDFALALIVRAFVRAQAEGRGQAQQAVALAGLRGALAALLCLFEERPDLARVWLIESTAAGVWAMQRRERNLAALTEQVLAHWDAPAVAAQRPLVAAGVMASILGLLQRHLVAHSPESPLGLLGPLVGVVSGAYLDDAQEIHGQVEQANALARRLRLARAVCPQPEPRQRPYSAREPLPGVQGPRSPTLPALVANPRAHRARECLVYVQGHPGASNAQIARELGISSRTQVCTLLSRLQRTGLVDRSAARPGHRNAWVLTERGRDVATRLTASRG